MKMDAALSPETLLHIYQDYDVTFHEHDTFFFCLISNDDAYYRKPLLQSPKRHMYVVGNFSFMLVYLTEIVSEKGNFTYM